MLSLRAYLTATLRLLFAVFLASLCQRAISRSGSEALDDVLALYGDEETLSLATGYRSPLSLAPAVATIITAQEIEQLGATSLAEVLETVPGIHVSSERGVSPVFVARGFFHSLNSQFLILIDGIPINDVANGGRPQGWTVPLHEIHRIEIIRGPGSALYGDGAYAGTINVIRYRASDIGESRIGLTAGTYQTLGAYYQTHAQWHGLEALFSVWTHTTEGYREPVRADEQSRIDALLGTHASQAPGLTSTGRDDLYVRFAVEQGDHWQFQTAFHGINHLGTGASGSGHALDPGGEYNLDVYSSSITWRPEGSNPDWSAEWQVSHQHTRTQADVTLLPPGTLFNLFPEGVKDQFELAVDQFRIKHQALYDGFVDHRVLLGFGIDYATNRSQEFKNFIETASGFILPVGPLQSTDELGVDPVIPNEERTITYAYIQDEWTLAPSWRLTTGVRLDWYSDIEFVINPRLSLVWTALQSMTVKALYGRAYRAPTFIDLYGNSIVALALEGVEPETLNTYEIVFENYWSPKLFSRLNFYFNDAQDLLVTDLRDPDSPISPAVNRNIAGMDNFGLEFEVRFEPSSTLDLRFNYAYQKHRDKNSFEPYENIGPEHQLFATLAWRFHPHWTLSARTHWLSQPHDYASLDLGLRYKPSEDLNVLLSVTNSTDNQRFEPTLYEQSLPDGIPLPGRQIMLQLNARF